MAVVLIVRPYGLLGRPQVAVRNTGRDRGRRSARRRRALKLVGAARARRACCCCRCSPALSPYALVLGIDVLIAVLFATSLHFIMGPGGMHSFGHAAYFGLGAYGAALLVKFARAADAGSRSLAAPLVAGARRAAVRLVRGAALRRLSRDADARLRADRLVDRVPVGGRDRRLQRHARHLADARRSTAAGAIICSRSRSRVAGVLLLRRMLFAPFGYAMRAGRDSPLRAEAIGIDVKRVHWIGFAIAGAICGLAGACSPSPRARSRPRRIAVGRSIDGLVMVLLGGIQTLTGPIVGAAVFTVPAGHHHAPDRILARAARRHHPAAGAGVPAAASSARCASGCAARRKPRMSVLSVRNLSQVVRRRARRRRRELRRRRGRVPGADRAERRRQVDLLQHDQRPARARQRRHPVRRTAASSACTPRDDLAARRRPHLPGRRDLRLDDGGRERADGADRACTARSSASARRARARHRDRALELLAQVGMADAADRACRSSPMATSSASSSRSRSPTSRACC